MAVSSIASRRCVFESSSTSLIAKLQHFVSWPSPHSVRRHASTTALAGKDRLSTQVLPTAPSSGLSRLPTVTILRNILLCSIFSVPILYKSSFSVLRTIANSNSVILNPDKNALLRAVIKPLLYKQFCAGVNSSEIRQTQDQNRRIGYSGVVLCYGKEIQIPASQTSAGAAESGHLEEATSSGEIRQFLEGNLQTLSLLTPGNWVGIKFTGAGRSVTQALMTNGNTLPEFVAAMDEICRVAVEKQCRIWIDAEQQILQEAIDRWTIDLQRKWNVDGRVLVYTTIQAYLKQARTKLQDMLQQAEKEGFTLAVKLVRGAYISNDERGLIHDTKENTDDSYNGIVESLLSGSNLGFESKRFPKTALVIAGHNPYSISTAWELVQKLGEKGQLKVVPDFAMLQGMGDVTACKVLRQAEEKKASGSSSGAPLRIYKCLTWGSVQECMQYLFRRVVENNGSADRMKDGLSAYVVELRRRIRKSISTT